MFRLIISHLSSNRSYAADLQASLLLHGVSSFVAHNDIEPTKEWQTEIETALATCDSLVALLHKDFHQSNWTDQEIGFAMGRGLPVFAVKFDHGPYGFIGRFQAFDGNNKKPFELAAELFDTFRKHKQTQGRMAQALIALFETSESFSLSKTLINYIEELQVWDSSFSFRLQTAVKSNTQISEAWGVPERVNAVIEKWK